MASATRLFCPPDRVLIRRSAMSPLMPKRPRMFLASWSLMPGKLAWTQSTQVASKSKDSTWCCAKVPILAFRFTSICPAVGTSFFCMTLSKVLFPAPLAPKMPMRPLMSKFAVAFSKSGVFPG
mmetsp:Transcript_70339/g.111116  ORF Transcript_70339/g.111116 Transcript_70339/m.111116 type:complete len:123 (-) Transcript_70339:32-400(-)